MNIELWVTLLARLVAGVLVERGKPDQAAWLNDALQATRAGRNIDAELQAAADKWAALGEPSFDEIAESRKRIQERIGG